MNLMKYSMKIEWSEEDNCYVVFLPEFTKAMQPVSDGKTYRTHLRSFRRSLGRPIF